MALMSVTSPPLLCYLSRSALPSSAAVKRVPSMGTPQGVDPNQVGIKTIDVYDGQPFWTGAAWPWPDLSADMHPTL
jgi:hypothetical protein